MAFRSQEIEKGNAQSRVAPTLVHPRAQVPHQVIITDDVKGVKIARIEG